MNFVDMFLDYTKDAESPTSYFRWAAYTTLSATLRRNVWIDLVYQKLYPNMYTLLLSRRSSHTKKSNPLKISLRLLQQVNNTKIINGRATVAGIIGILTNIFHDNEGNQITGGSGVLYAEELSSLLIEDQYATDTLTDWYDGFDKWSSNLSSTGTVTIENLCLTMLVSSNEELIRSVYDSRAMQGGLLARTYLISESKRRHKNSLMYAQRTSIYGEELITHLKKVAHLHGEMKLTDEARKYYDDWYNDFEPLDFNSSTTGIEGRIHTHALKLSIIKSVAERYDRVITRTHMEEAIQECIDLLPSYLQFSGGSVGPIAKVGREIILDLLDAPNYCLTKKQIMFKYWSVTSPVINQVIEALEEADNIESFVQDEQFSIRLTKSFIERFSDG